MKYDQVAMLSGSLLVPFTDGRLCKLADTAMTRVLMYPPEPDPAVPIKQQLKRFVSTLSPIFGTVDELVDRHAAAIRQAFAVLNNGASDDKIRAHERAVSSLTPENSICLKGDAREFESLMSARDPVQDGDVGHYVTEVLNRLVIQFGALVIGDSIPQVRPSIVQIDRMLAALTKLKEQRQRDSQAS